MLEKLETAMATGAENTLHAIGNTPVVRLRRVVPPGSADVFVKLEYINPTGSHKERMALAMIESRETEARSMCRRLAREEGIFADLGCSGGSPSAQNHVGAGDAGRGHAHGGSSGQQLW
jgi:cysteine synthase